MSKPTGVAKAFFAFLPFWLFLLLFKFGAGLHYSLQSPLGEQLMPLWVVGLVMGGAAFLQLIFDVPAGHLLDRYGYRRLLKVGVVIFVIAALCYVSGLTLVTYLLSAFLSVFGWLFFTPGANAYLLSSAKKEYAGRFMSFRDVFMSVGIVLSSAVLPFVLLLLPQHIGLLLVGLLLLALLAISFAPKDTNSVHAEEKIATHHHYVKRKSLSTLKAIQNLNPASTMLLLLSMSSGMFYGVIWFAVPLVLAHQVENSIMSFGLGIFDFSVVVFGFALGSLADRINKRTLVFFGLLVFALFGMLLGLGFGLVFILFGFIATAGEEMAGLSLWSWLHSLDMHHAQDGTVAAAINLFEDFGWMIGPAMAGFLYEFAGPSWCIVAGAVPILITWLIYLFFFKDHHRAHVSAVLPPRKPHLRRHKA